jgi:hypothetical protein
MPYCSDFSRQGNRMKNWQMNVSRQERKSRQDYQRKEDDLAQTDCASSV